MLHLSLLRSLWLFFFFFLFMYYDSLLLLFDDFIFFDAHYIVTSTSTKFMYSVSSFLLVRSLAPHLNILWAQDSPTIPDADPSCSALGNAERLQKASFVNRFRIVVHEPNITVSYLASTVKYKCPILGFSTSLAHLGNRRVSIGLFFAERQRIRGRER